MNFKKVLVSELKPAKYNPRKDLKPTDPEFQRIKKSIEEFGYVDPVIVNSDYTVIGGHQRIAVLKELGQAEIDVVVVDLPKTKEKALNVALNKITGEWDFQQLSIVLSELKEEDFDISITGFTDKELKDIDAELFGPEGLGEQFTLPDGDHEFTTISFTLTKTQAEFVKLQIGVAKKRLGEVPEGGNQNGNGNALFLVVSEWSAQKI